MYRYVMITEMSDYIIIRYLLHCTRTLSLGHYYQKSRPLSCIKMMIAMFISWTRFLKKLALQLKSWDIYKL